ncbi:HLA class II histocompatibility antigen gamma chain [Callorhinchus milii]|uniref:HLA class II histocompatibility antigen gamma chain-like isoform 2 n=1 Tax=Callorhinchus milii TaxID=7868 RepID=K4GAA9_CALMI|nr:HLA class II histocompatibility antigen gamma chain [Callorhinchus milii]AFM89451.1 HLA class II histocompatibility antigen gamma chain-like isoform 2 [Callorhinchus milii]AFM90114.1 HLA class II histocompatibility antigen gamma chain-like isoform 2 [Callorhinchus milii]|eukprot:gi/632979213/ref/XP_007906346.1/ PREDICTED: HLA class II histocompatibility antigen gamma chain [Callorhinchus milii]
MADEQQSTLLNHSQDSISTGTTEPSIARGQNSGGGSCSRGLMWTGVTILGVLLIAGQVVSVMFLMKQQDKITDLQKTTTEIQNKNSAPPAKPKTTIRLRPMMNMPMMYDLPEPEAPKEKTPTPAPPLTLMQEVEELLKKENLTQELPKFKGTLFSNLRTLRENVEEPMWREFETWLRNWLMFQLIQEQQQKISSTIAPWHKPRGAGRKMISSMMFKPMALDTNDQSTVKPEEEMKLVKVVPAKTNCQRERDRIKLMPGVYEPTCDKAGDYTAEQCHASSGYCWCVKPDGTEIPGTRVRGQRLHCQRYTESEEPRTSGLID